MDCSNFSSNLLQNMKEIYGAYVPQDKIHVALTRDIVEANIQYQKTNGEVIITTNFKIDAIVIIADVHLSEFELTAKLYQDRGIINDISANSYLIIQYCSSIKSWGTSKVPEWIEYLYNTNNQVISSLSSLAIFYYKNNHFTDVFSYKQLYGPTLYLLGQKITPKYGGIGGGGLSGRWTSPASKSLRYLDNTIKGYLGTKYTLPNKTPLARIFFGARGYIGTKSIGGAVGKLVPYIGVSLMLKDTYDIFYDLGYNYGPSTWYGDDDNKWFK